MVSVNSSTLPSLWGFPGSSGVSGTSLASISYWDMGINNPFDTKKEESVSKKLQRWLKYHRET